MVDVNLAAVNLNLIVALDALLAEQSVTRAAERVGVSQPAMSYSLRQLRAHFDDPLLTRGLLTPFAESLRAGVTTGLSELQIVLEARQRFDPATSARTFRLAASDVFQVVGLHRFLAALAAEAPAVDVIVRPWEDADAASLASGAVDLLLGSPEQAPAGLSSTSLYDESFVCIARHPHPAIDGELGLDAYCHLPHVLVARDEDPGMVDRVLAQQQRQRRVALRIPDFAGIGHVIAGTDMIATVPERLADTLARSLPLQILAPPIPLPNFAVALHWHGRFDAEPGHRWLRNRLVQL